MKLRFYLAMWMAKLSIVALKATGHNGTDFPGTVALKICPDFMKYVKKPGKIIGITGTNGKTTITNLVIDMLAADGITVLENNKGSNTLSGIVTSFVYGCTAMGECNYDTAVLEIDERTARVLFSDLEPDILLINNLTRDSFMRNAHPEFIAQILTDNMPAKTKLILNGDDLITANVAPTNERAYFGIDKMDSDVEKCINLINDMQICPHCANVLQYEYLRYHHIGKAYCPNCGFKSPECEYRGHDVDLKKMNIKIDTPEGSNTFRLLNDNVFNIYNVVALVAMMTELGYKPKRTAELMKSIEIVASRYDVIEVGSYRIIKQMSKEKNALASSRVFDSISTKPNKKELIFAMNCRGDEKTWTENAAWMYDCDFEFLNDDSISNIVCTGPRRYDYKLRLMLAGIDESKISLAPTEMDATKYLRLNEPEDVYVLYGTITIDIAEKLIPLVEQEIRERGKN